MDLTRSNAQSIVLESDSRAGHTKRCAYIKQTCARIPFVVRHRLSTGDNAMSKTAMVRARVEPSLKEHAESVFQRLGLNATQAITLFYKQVELREGLPFEVAIPTSTTAKTFEATDAGKDLIVCKDADDMFEKLGI
jgi:DNA-damage-inducible protein J